MRCGLRVHHDGDRTALLLRGRRRLHGASDVHVSFRNVLRFRLRGGQLGVLRVMNQWFVLAARFVAAAEDIASLTVESARPGKCSAWQWVFASTNGGEQLKYKARCSLEHDHHVRGIACRLTYAQTDV